MTLFRLLTEGSRALKQAGDPDGDHDARQLLMAAFHLDMVHFLLNRMQELEDSDYNRSCIELYRSMIEKRRRRCPLQQILGSQEFMGLEFYVNQHVLIPRQDTETLVELVLEQQKNQEIRLLDLCTGSGCIAVSLAVKGGYRQVTAADISEEALKVARRNWERLRPENQEMQFFQGDLFDALEKDTETFDVITANPPYIPTEVIRGLEPEVRDHEPMLALDGTADGLHFYRRIAAEAGRWLRPGGRIYLEIGYDQGEAVSGLLAEAGFTEIQVVKDLPGKDRVVAAVYGSRREQTGGSDVRQIR